MSLVRLLTVFILLSLLLMVFADAAILYGQYRQPQAATEQTMRGVFFDGTDRLKREMGEIFSAVQTAVNQDSVCAYCRADAPARYENRALLQTAIDDLVHYIGPVDAVILTFADGASYAVSDGGVGMRQRIALKQYAAESASLKNPVAAYRSELADALAGYYLLLVPIADGEYLGSCAALCDVSDLIARNLSIDWPYLIACGDFIVAANDADLSAAFAKGALGDRFEMKDTAYTLMNARIDGAGWRVVSAYSDAQLVASLRSQLRGAMAFLAVVVLVQALLAVALYKRMVGPVVAITRQLSEADVGVALSLRAPDPNRNELVALTRRINEMFERVRRLNEDMSRTSEMLYRTNIARLREKVMFLQAQINPHFLYNNLQCIRGMSRAGDSEAVAEMVTCMAKLYRYCVKGGDRATLSEEIACVKWYIEIMRLRYAHEMSLEIEVDSAAACLPLPCMSLQPLLENAFLHGLIGTREGPWRLSIRCEAGEGGYRVRVGDNGAGMPPEQMEALNRLLQKSPLDNDEDTRDRIGIFNVNSRVRLLLGMACGLSLHRNADGGVDAVIDVRNNP